MKRSPLRRTGTLKRKTRIAPRSKKTEARAPLRKQFVADVMRERGCKCEAGQRIVTNALVSDAALAYGLSAFHPKPTGHPAAALSIDGKTTLACEGIAVDVHEILTRARGGDILDRTNVLCVCRRCHDFIHRNPVRAKLLGLLASAHGG